MTEKYITRYNLNSDLSDVVIYKTKKQVEELISLTPLTNNASDRIEFNLFKYN